MTTDTSEALAKATNSEGLMKSSYFKLKFNQKTGQWEKEQIEEVIKKPIFPGIRDVTPDYTEEGKKFKTIPKELRQQIEFNNKKECVEKIKDLFPKIW